MQETKRGAQIPSQFGNKNGNAEIQGVDQDITGQICIISSMKQNKIFNNQKLLLPAQKKKKVNTVIPIETQGKHIQTRQT